MGTLENAKKTPLRSYLDPKGRFVREPDPRGQILLELVVIVLFWWGMYVMLDILGRAQIDHFRRQPGLPTYERAR